MKKFFVSILLVLTLLPIAAETKKTGETMRLSLTISNVVYVGLTDSAVTSTTVPSKNISDVGFYFNSSTGKWETEDCYIYLISFVSDKVALSINCNNLKNGDETLAYKATIQPVDESTSINIDSKGSKDLYKETKSSYDEPRYKSWQFNVVVDPDLNNPSIAMGSTYTATFTLTLKVGE